MLIAQHRQTVPSYSQKVEATKQNQYPAIHTFNLNLIYAVLVPEENLKFLKIFISWFSSPSTWENKLCVWHQHKFAGAVNVSLVIQDSTVRNVAVTSSSRADLCSSVHLSNQYREGRQPDNRKKSAIQHQVRGKGLKTGPVNWKSNVSNLAFTRSRSYHRYFPINFRRWMAIRIKRC